ncbi:uncharacterized protein LOC143059505 [Mytilus galloprovincialis]|uniref:uncharacterized protein LOC143059505 n=1 Tax=Mytilus galloprovincialis TaxID=29158 RepID=UPI003F7C2231
MFGLTQVNAFKSSLTAGFECGGENISIVPIAILFSAVFGFLLLIQFSCMLYHRFSTLVHITANTDLRSTEDEHIAEIMNNIIKHAIQRSRNRTKDVSDKCRQVLDGNRSVLEAKNTPCNNFRQLIIKNKDKLKNFITINESSNLQDGSIDNKVKAKWQRFVKKLNGEQNGKTNEKSESTFADVVNKAMQKEKEKAKEVEKRSSTAEPKTNQVCPVSTNDSSEPTCNGAVNIDSNV